MVRIISATKTRGPERVWCRLWYRPENGGNVTTSVTVAAKVKVCVKEQKKKIKKKIKRNFHNVALKKIAITREEKRKVER